MDGNQENLLSRIPPSDAEAELAVLSSMLFDKDAVDVAYELLKGDDFYRPDYKAVFEAMTELFTTSKPIDIVTLKSKLDEHGTFDKIGGQETLLLIAGNISTSANIRHYCKIISDKSIARRLIKSSQDITNAGYEGKLPVDLLLEKAEKNIYDITQNKLTRSYAHVRDILVDAITEAEKASLAGNKITGVATGFYDFDRITAGLHPSELILVAARPAMGKSALGINIATNAALKQNTPTAFFTLEMSREMVASRILCAEALVDSAKFRTGSLGSQEWGSLAHACLKLNSAPLYIDDTPSISVAELRSKCQRIQIEHGLGLIVIDYLQLMRGNTRTESRQNEVSEISRTLKGLAGELKVPIVALAQLSRALESRADKRPMMSDLRESGAIEQDADIVTFIYRDDYYNPDSEAKGKAEWIISKHRSGEVGTVHLAYIGNYTKFESSSAPHTK